MGKFVVALSAVSSGRSSWLVLGVSGMAFTRGTGAVWAVVGYIVAEMFQFIYIGRRLRRETEAFGSLTLLDYFESRFQDKRQLIRITGAAIIAIFITAYVAAQLVGAGKILHATFGLDPRVGLLVGAVVVVFYTLMGGFLAVAWTDLIQGLLMTAVAVVLPIVGIIKNAMAQK